jgi:hypothetical protein
MARITLDVSHGTRESLRDALRYLTTGTGVATRDTGVRTAGGWPEVEFAGTRTELELVLRRYDGDGPHVAELLALVEDEPFRPAARVTT